MLDEGDRGMSASDRTPVGDPSTDPVRDSDSALPQTYVRTHGDELVTRDSCLSESNARTAEELTRFAEWMRGRSYLGPRVWAAVQEIADEAESRAAVLRMRSYR